MQHATATPKPAHDPQEHRKLRNDDFWRDVPGFADIDVDTFLDSKWQAQNSVTKPEQLAKLVGELTPPGFLEDVAEGFQRATMTMRVSPYILGLIDWTTPYEDPLRTQFIPVASRILADHPKTHLDSQCERIDSPVQGITHRYPDKAVFLVLDTCPVYCRCCTRSYAVGGDTAEVEKVSLKVNRKRWAQGLQYIRSRPELEDIIVSGGDAYQLRSDQIVEIGTTLLGFDNIVRVRFATKGLAVLPQKIVSEPAWLDAVTEVVELGRKMGKSVVVHTHFSHPREITWISRLALSALFKRGITVRSQCVLQRGVNDDVHTVRLLVKRLGYVNVEPYYIFLSDLVPGVEDLRTTLATGLDIEKHVRGVTAGFHTPAFVVDTQGGGGTRVIHSYEHYDRENGIAVYASPNLKGDRALFYFDPLDELSPEAQKRWGDPESTEAMLDEAVARTGLVRYTSASS